MYAIYKLFISVASVFLCIQEVAPIFFQIIH